MYVYILCICVCINTIDILKILITDKRTGNLLKDFVNSDSTLHSKTFIYKYRNCQIKFKYTFAKMRILLFLPVYDNKFSIGIYNRYIGIHIYNIPK